MLKISAYIPTYNCGKYLKQAVDSVLSQTYHNFELIIIDDASIDNTAKILKEYKNNPKVRIITNKKNIGFVRSANKAIKLAKGDYILRLDGDDYLDENSLMILANILDRHPEIGLVYPDFFHINEEGDIIDYFRKKKLGKEIELLDLPPNSGGTMIRKSCYHAIGGYRNDIRMQDKYDLWIKFITKFKAYNVNLPLYYYRWHGKNISSNVKKLLKTKRYIKEKFVQEKYKKSLPKILAIIPARAKSHIYPNFPTRKIAGKPLISYSISAIKKTPLIKKAIFVTEDKTLAKKAKKYGINTLIRSKELAGSSVGIEPTISYVLNYLKKKEKIFSRYRSHPLYHFSHYYPRTS